MSFAGLNQDGTHDKADAAKNFLNAGFMYYGKNEYEKALALYKRALEITPDNPLAYTDNCKRLNSVS